jgi:hypothetical protein
VARESGFPRLALLRGPAASLNSFANIRDRSIRSGNSVVAIGCPYPGLLTSDFTVTTGYVSSLSGIMNDTRYLQVSAAVQPGNSGGPLFDSSGLIVGMVAMKLDALKTVRAEIAGNARLYAFDYLQCERADRGEEVIALGLLHLSPRSCGERSKFADSDRVLVANSAFAERTPHPDPLPAKGRGEGDETAHVAAPYAGVYWSRSRSQSIGYGNPCS